MADKEYIERNALIAEYDRIHVGAPGGARKLMVEAPAADVVEVVRCKDCKYWSAMDNGFSFHHRGRTDGECKMLWELHYSERHLTDGEHFCSYGERKDHDR